MSCHSFDLVNNYFVSRDITPRAKKHHHRSTVGTTAVAHQTTLTLEVKGRSLSKSRLSLSIIRFCQKSGPINVTSRASKLTVSFASNRQYAGYGAECTVACTDFETEDQPTEDRCCESMALMLEEMKVQTSLLQDIKQLMPPLETASKFSTVDETMDPWSSTTTTGTNVPTSSITTGTTIEHYTCLGGTVIPIDKVCAVWSKRWLFESYIQVCDGVFDCPQSENSDGGEDEDDETCCESGSGSTDCCGSGSGSSGNLYKLSKD